MSADNMKPEFERANQSSTEAAEGRKNNRLAAENNASLPLFKLPVELRDAIYRLVLGGQSIHIWQTFTPGPNPHLCHSLCQIDLSEPEAEEQSKETTSVLWKSLAYWQEHTVCSRSRGKDHSWRSKHREQSISDKLAVLYTCRQIYNEAKTVLYRTNVFHFYHARTFGDFLTDLDSSNPNLCRAMRRISLSFSALSEGHERQGKADIVNVVERSRSLQELNLDLDLWLLESRPAMRAARLKEIFVQLKVLPLKKLNITFRHYNESRIPYPYEWGVWAEEVMQAILKSK